MSSKPINAAAFAYWSAVFRKEPPSTRQPDADESARSDDGSRELDQANAPVDQWAALKDDPGSREADQLRFLVMDENAALLRLMADSSSGWTEQPDQAISQHGTLRIWNGTDLNGQHYQLLLLATPANDAVL